MEIKQILQPKYFLIGFGVLFLIAGTYNFVDAENAAETAYPDTSTDRDVFYEQTFGAFSIGLASLSLVTGIFVKGRELSIMAMAASGSMLVVFSLHYTSGEVVDYGYNDPVLFGVLDSLLALQAVSGYIHLEDE